MLFGGFNSIVGNIPEGTEIARQATPLLDRGRHVTTAIFTELFRWWMFNVHSYKGKAAYIALLLLTILMFLPVVCVLLAISVFASYGNVLFIGMVVDAVLYVLMAVFGKTFLTQFMGRYYRLFPEAGRKHEERKYDKMMRRRNKELEEEERNRKRDKRSSFYEDEDYEDDYYEDEEYEDEDEDEDFYEDEDYEDEDFEDDYDDPRRDRYREPVASSTFDFFAGCTSRESVDKKYKSLVKLYHPDNMDGDTAALQEINAQYAEAKKRFQ